MKTTSVGLIALLACGATSAEPVSEQRTWQQAYRVAGSAPRLTVSNIWGNVRVRAGDSRDIVVSANERRSAPTTALFERSKTQLRLDIAASSDEVSLVVDSPDRIDGRTEVCRGCKLEYQFEITVPAGTVVDVRTVTEGRVEVEGVRGRVTAANVNGPVAVNGLTECASIESVNGALDVRFARSPSENCSLKTINGEITIGLPEGTGLDAILSVAHGTLESEFDVQPIALPARIERSEQEDRSSYRFEHPAGLRVGSGGPSFTFASLNGDVRIVKNK